MTNPALYPLVAISQLVLDRSLGDLERAARARAQSLSRLEGLAISATPSDLPFSVAAQADLRYARWADARRAEINLSLARQTAEWEDARQRARQAFGRVTALRSLADRR